MIDLEGYNGFGIHSRKMLEVFEAVHDFARQGQPVIMFGPSGSGKEFLARYYYSQYKKASHCKGAFKSLNCSGLVKETAHSELFGHAKGSFTDAYQEKPGHFELAEDGVLFLDEIGDLDEAVQVMLNRAMDENIHEARRLGGDTNYSTQNTRVICATELGKEQLRDSLLFRSGLQIHVPGLDDRMEDVESAIQHFCARAIEKRLDRHALLAALLNCPVKEVSDRQITDPKIDALIHDISAHLTPLVQARDWPGNFRALRTAVDSGMIRAKKMQSPAAFIEDVKHYFLHHLGDYSIAVRDGNQHQNATVMERGPGGSHKWMEALNRSLPGFREEEKTRISAFLTAYETLPFKRVVFQNYVSLSVRVAQDRISTLIQKNILEKSATQSNVYQVNPAFDRNNGQSISPPRLMHIPQAAVPGFLPEKIMEATGIIANAQGLFISENDAERRALFLATLADSLQKEYDVLYFSFSEQALEEFISQCTKHLMRLNMEGWFSTDKDDEMDPVDQIISMSGYMNQSFSKHRKTVIILNDIDQFYTSESQSVIEKMIRYWMPVQFILGSKKQFFQQYYANRAELMELNL